MRVFYTALLIGAFLISGCGSPPPSTPSAAPNPPQKTAGDSTTKPDGSASAPNAESESAGKNGSSTAESSKGGKAPGSNLTAEPGSPQTGSPAGNAGSPSNATGSSAPGIGAKSTADAVRQLMSKARTSAATDPAAAYQLMKEAHALDAKDRTVLGGLIQFGQVIGLDFVQKNNETQAFPFFLESAAYGRKLQELGGLSGPEATAISGAIYNEACVFCKTAKLEEALQSLQAAFELGFNDMKLFDTDPDLNPLRELAAFKALKTQAIEKATAKEKEIIERQVQETLKKMENHKPFPFDFDLKDVDGNSVKLADYKGKVLIVDIWGTWCPPCKKEIPHFLDLKKKYQEMGLEIVGINYENGSDEENIAVIKDFIAKNGITYPCVLGDPATRGQVPNFEGFPTTLFLDRTGQVRMSEVGYRPLEILESVVTKLINE